MEKYPGSVLPWSQLGVANADLQPMLRPPDWGIKGQIFFFPSSGRCFTKCYLIFLFLTTCFWAGDVRFSQFSIPGCLGVELKAIASLQRRLEVMPAIKPEPGTAGLALKSTKKK